LIKVKISYKNRGAHRSWASAGGKTGICLPLEIGTKNQKFLEKLKSAVYFRVINLILAMTVYLPIWHSHCTRTRFTVLVWCSDEFGIHSCPLLCLQMQVAKLASRLFHCWSLLCNNTVSWQLIFKGLLQVTVADILSHLAVECRQLPRQVMQRDSGCW